MIRNYPDRFSNRDEHVAYVLANLAELHDDLDVLQDIINNDTGDVPQRFEDTAHGLLAEADASAIGVATRVLHRLYLWHKYPRHSDESYFSTHGSPLEVVS